MTEAEWLACDDPDLMLEFLRDNASDRKLRLFACACCRRIWRLLVDKRSQRAIEITEDYADRKAEERALDEAAAAAEDVYQQLNLDWDEANSVVPDAAPLLESEAYAAWPTCESYCGSRDKTHVYSSTDAIEVARAVVSSLGEDSERQASERRCQAALVRCIVGNPFRPAILDPRWLAWNDAIVVRLAQGIYEDRAFDRLPILADALEDAGCADAGLLGHLRDLGPHVRGCWVVDLVLGKS